MSTQHIGGVEKGKHRPEIDGLRAFAVIAVIINHFNKEILPGGYLGVDIFFVISGYVITSSLSGRPSRDFKDFISGFYERRIKRLVPALSIFVLIMSIVICLFDPSPGTTLKTGLTSLFGLSNLYLLHQSIDYFAQSTELNVFTHTWSLGVEEQFYILFPLLIWFSGFGRQTRNGARNLFVIVCTLTFASLIGFLYLYQTNQPAAYFMMPSRFWEMAAGCLVFIVFQNRVSVERMLGKAPPFLVLVLIVGVMLLPISLATASTIAVVVLSSILIAALKEKTAAFKVFTNPKIVYVGLISYSLYLWHWGVLSISRWTIGIHWWTLPFQAALLLGLGVASYRWIETPLRKGKWFGKRWTTILAGGGILAFLSGCLTILDKNQDLYLGVNRDAQMNNDSSPHLKMKRLECMSPLPKQACIERPIQKNDKTFYFAGDSHTGHLIPMAGILRKEHGIGVIFSTYRNFPSSLVSDKEELIISPKSLREQIHANEAMKKLFRKNISALKSGDVIVISSYFDHHLKEDSYNRSSPSRKFFYNSDGRRIHSNRIFEHFRTDLNEWARYARKKGLNIVLFSEIPIFRGVANPPDTWACTKEWFRPVVDKGCASNFFESKSDISNRISDTNSLLLSIALENPNVYYFDVFEILCPGKESCATRIGKIQTYRDDDHLSREGGEFIAPRFTEFLESNGLL